MKDHCKETTEFLTLVICKSCVVQSISCTRSLEMILRSMAWASPSEPITYWGTLEATAIMAWLRLSQSPILLTSLRLQSSWSIVHSACTTRSFYKSSPNRSLSKQALALIQTLIQIEVQTWRLRRGVVEPDPAQQHLYHGVRRLREIKDPWLQLGPYPLQKRVLVSKPPAGPNHPIIVTGSSPQSMYRFWSCKPKMIPYAWLATSPWTIYSKTPTAL